MMNFSELSPAAKSELIELAERYGGPEHLPSDALVEHARNPDSALHPYFEWDDAEAARQYRAEQAKEHQN